MAEPETPARGGSPLGMITRKVGPLPLWAYAVIVVVAYYLYKHYSGSSSSTSTNSTTDTTANPVPPFDAATSAGSGGIGYTPAQSTVNNYYYGDQNAGQAGGGGTSSGFGPNPPGQGPITSQGPGSKTPSATFPAEAATSGVPGGSGSIKVAGGRLTQ